MVTCSDLYLFHNWIQRDWILFQVPELPVIQKACPGSVPRLAQHTFLILQDYPGLKAFNLRSSLFHEFWDPPFPVILLDRAVEEIVVVGVQGLPRHSGLHRRDLSLQLSLEKRHKEGEGVGWDHVCSFPAGAVFQPLIPQEMVEQAQLQSGGLNHNFLSKVMMCALSASAVRLPDVPAAAQGGGQNMLLHSLVNLQHFKISVSVGKNFVVISGFGFFGFLK